MHCISDNVSAVTPDLLQIPKVRWYNTLAEMLPNSPRVRPQYLLSVSENNIFVLAENIYFLPPTKAQ